MSKFYDIGLQKYREEKIRVCDKNSIPNFSNNSDFIFFRLCYDWLYFFQFILLIKS